MQITFGSKGIELDEDQKIMYQNLWAMAHTAVEGILQLVKKERSTISDPRLCLELAIGQSRQICRRKLDMVAHTLEAEAGSYA